MDQTGTKGKLAHVSEMTAALTKSANENSWYFLLKVFFQPLKISLFSYPLGLKSAHYLKYDSRNNCVYNLEKLMKFSHLFSVFIILIFDRIPKTNG